MQIVATVGDIKNGSLRGGVPKKKIDTYASAVCNDCIKHPSESWSNRVGGNYGNFFLMVSPSKRSKNHYLGATIPASLSYSMLCNNDLFFVCHFFTHPKVVQMFSFLKKTAEKF